MSKQILVNIDKNNEEPLYIQIYNCIRKLIMEDYFHNNERLPSIRTLSAQLGVNTVTVINAYRLLQNDGFAEIRIGSGSYVKKRELKVISANPEAISDELYTSEDIELMNKGNIDLNSAISNFATTTPSPESFPITDFKKVIINTIHADGAEAFNYQESLGFEGLRQIIANKFLTGVIRGQLSNIQIISGAQQGIDIVAKALLNKDDCVVVENPTYVGANAVFKSRGAKIVGVTIKEDGMDMEELSSVMRKYRPKIIYTIPTYHNPTGYTYSLGKRKELLRLASAFGSYIIEDDYLSELNYYENTSVETDTSANTSTDTSTVAIPLIKLDANDRTIFIKSFSKLLMPGLRIGFMAAPSNIMEEINKAKHATDISTSGLIQRAFFRYLQAGFWEKHLGSIKQMYKQRYEEMLYYLKNIEELGAGFTQPGGGFNFWVKLPAGIDANKLYFNTSKRGVVFIPGSVFMNERGKSSDNYIRLSFAQSNETDIKYGMTVIEDCMRKELKGYNDFTNSRIYPLL